MELTFTGVSKSYGKNRALCGFTATLTPGVCALLGPNGAGKTTLMNVITDNLKADAGTVTFADDGELPRDVRDMGISFREKIGYMPQNPGLYRNFTAEEYLAYMAGLKGVADGKKGKEKKKETAAQIDAVLEAVELGPVRRRRVGALSGGRMAPFGHPCSHSRQVMQVWAVTEGVFHETKEKRRSKTPYGQT